MRVKGITESAIMDICANIGLETDNLRRKGNFLEFRVIPHSSRSKYARLSSSGRRVKATCYHGFRDFIRECFDAGAVQVQSAWGKWYTLDDFERALPDLAWKNVGSYMQPAYMIELCDCEEGV